MRCTITLLICTWLKICTVDYYNPLPLNTLFLLQVCVTTDKFLETITDLRKLNPGMSNTAIAKRLGVSQASVSRAFSKLERRKKEEKEEEAKEV